MPVTGQEVVTGRMAPAVVSIAPAAGTAAETPALVRASAAGPSPALGEATRAPARGSAATTATPERPSGPDRVENRVAAAATAAATLALAVAALWGAASPIHAGHDASTASVGIAADQTLRWGTLAPVLEHTSSPPPPELVYAHHPWGIFWLTTALVAVLGRSDLTCRLAPMLLSVATPALLHLLGSRLWRPAAGAAAAVMFCALPVTLAYASFNALEVPVIAWSTLMLAGGVAVHQGAAAPRHRDTAMLLCGAAMTCLSDWQGMLVVGALALGATAGAAWAWRRGTRPPRATLWRIAALAGMVVVVVAAHGAAFHALGKLPDLWASYGLRSATARSSAWQAIASRRFWLETTFTPVGLALIAVSGPLAAWRAARLRRPLELVPLALLLAAATQYLIFRQGADVHVFWPHLFAPAAALALAGLVATTAARSRRAWMAALAGAVMVSAVVAGDGVRALRWARTSGGRFDERGQRVASGADQVAALRWLAPQLPGDGLVALDGSLPPSWAHLWSLRRPTARNLPLGHGPCDGVDLGGAGAIAWVGDLRGLPEGRLRGAATRCAVRAVGPLLIAVPGPWAPITSLRIEESVAPGLAGFFTAGPEPLRRVVADPWGTWELRRHLEEAAALPAEKPVFADDHRIAHDAALDAGDGGAAAIELAAALEGTVPLEAAFDDGTVIVALRPPLPGAPGATTTLLLRAGGPLDEGVELVVRGRVVQRASGSITMADPKPRDLAMGPRVPATLWKRGWLYAVELARPLRPGVEELRASFRATRFPARPPRAVGGSAEVSLDE